MERESIAFDAVIVGAGPSGLAAAIRLMQLGEAQGEERSICVLEKGSEVGAHILSGAVVETRALDELLPDWTERNSPLDTPMVGERFEFLTANRSFRLPTPPQMHNTGNFVVSLGNVCRWLAEQAESLGIEIFPGFSAAEVLYDEEGAVYGVATRDMGLNRDNTPGPNFEPGVEIHARQTLFCEGCHGSLTKELMDRFDLRDGVDPQTYGLGLKELWDVPADVHNPGEVAHTVGWPMDRETYGGGFIYHQRDQQIAVGFVVGLDYRNPHRSPFEDFQRFKTHPRVRALLKGGKRVSYGARALVEGGYQSLPRLDFPGGVLAGDTAGFLNVPKIKGTHTAMKSGIVAAEAVDAALNAGNARATDLRDRLEDTWLMDELYRARNLRPSFRHGFWAGLAYSAVDTYVLRGRAPWTLHHHADHAQLRPLSESKPIDYPKPDGKLTFDRLSSVFLSNTNHAEGQPVHLRLRDAGIPGQVNRPVYGGPETRYCPAGVYEYVRDEDSGDEMLQINAQNCVHCKSCDIKDPKQNIDWVVPQGADGPNYPNM